MQEVAQKTMNQEPLVTVITVFLNAERFIEEAISSVFAQDYRNWELVLVDDGSTDGSTEIALRYARRYSSRVRYMEHTGHKNRGISASQNLAVSAAKGEFIAFLDSDDVWLREKLEQQVAVLLSQPEAMMVYGKTQYWYSWNTNALDEKPDLILEPGVEPNSLLRPPTLFVRLLREEIPIPCPSDVMIRRIAASDCGAFEESFRCIFTDQVLYAKLSLKWPVIVSDQNWFKYRKHSDSAVATVKKNGEMRSARLLYLKWLSNYVADQGITDTRVRRAIANAKLRARFPGLLRLRPHIKYRALLIKEYMRASARRILPGTLYRLLRTSGH